MLDPTNEEHIRRSERYAPLRLARADVASFRDLYVRAYAAVESPAQYRVTIYLERGKGGRTLARLGRDRPRCVVSATWAQKRKDGEWGLDVTVVAFSAGIGRNQMKVGTHRFRKTSTRTQFCREISHLVRLGLGWAKRWHR